MKDIINHYRTLVAEALESISDYDRLENLGRALDWKAYEWSRKIHPPRADSPAPSLEGWQPLGWTTERPSFAHFEPEMNLSELQDQINRLAERTAFPQHVMQVDSSIESYFAAKEAPLRERADQLREALLPALEKIGEVLGKPDMLEWRTPEVRTVEAMDAMRHALNIKPFEPPPVADLVSMQDMINQAIRAAEEAHLGSPVYRYIVGLEPGQEWIEFSRAKMLERCTYESAAVTADSFYAVPVYPHPDNRDVMRVRVEDLIHSPYAREILGALSDLTDTVDNDPTT